MKKIVALLEWTFGVSFGPADASILKTTIGRNWSKQTTSGKQDESGQTIVAYLVALQDIIEEHLADNAGRKTEKRVKEMVYGIFENQFLRAPKLGGGYGTIIRNVHLALETLRPGCTGVSPPRQPAAKTAPSPPGQLLPPNRVPPQQTSYPGQLAPQQPPYPGQFPLQQPAYPNQFGQDGLAGSDTNFQNLVRLQREAELMTFATQIQALKHEMAMQTARAIKF
jgi:hypothetical protein